MKKLTHGLFLRWWLLMSVVTVSVLICNHFNVFQTIWKQDSTKLSFAIFGVLASMSVWCGYNTFVLSSLINSNVLQTFPAKAEETVIKIIHGEEMGWFASQMCLNLGMIGTVIGFIMMLVGFSHVDVSNVKSVQDLLASMSGGMSTALYTTLAGLVSMQILQLQYFNLSRALEQFKHE